MIIHDVRLEDKEGYNIMFGDINSALVPVGISFDKIGTDPDYRVVFGGDDVEYPNINIYENDYYIAHIGFNPYTGEQYFLRNNGITGKDINNRGFFRVDIRRGYRRYIRVFASKKDTQKVLNIEDLKKISKQDNWCNGDNKEKLVICNFKGEFDCIRIKSYLSDASFRYWSEEHIFYIPIPEEYTSYDIPFEVMFPTWDDRVTNLRNMGVFTADLWSKEFCYCKELKNISEVF